MPFICSWKAEEMMNIQYGGTICSPKSHTFSWRWSLLSTYERAASALWKDWGPNLFPSTLHQSGPLRTDLEPQFLAFFLCLDFIFTPWSRFAGAHTHTFRLSLTSPPPLFHFHGLYMLECFLILLFFLNLFMTDSNNLK